MKKYKGKENEKDSITDSIPVNKSMDGTECESESMMHPSSSSPADKTSSTRMLATPRRRPWKRKAKNKKSKSLPSSSKPRSSILKVLSRSTRRSRRARTPPPLNRNSHSNSTSNAATREPTSSTPIPNTPTSNRQSYKPTFLAEFDSESMEEAAYSSPLQSPSSTPSPPRSFSPATAIVLLLHPTQRRFEILRLDRPPPPRTLPPLEEVLARLPSAATLESLQSLTYRNLCDLRGHLVDPSAWGGEGGTQFWIATCFEDGGTMTLKEYVTLATPVWDKLRRNGALGPDDVHYDDQRFGELSSLHDGHMNHPNLDDAADDDDPREISAKAITKPPTLQSNLKTKTQNNDNLNDEWKQKLKELAKACPKSTPAEQTRFLKARKGSVEGAISQLNGYLEWRIEHRLHDDDIHHDDDDSDSDFDDQSTSFYLDNDYDDDDDDDTDDFYSACSNPLPDDEHHWNRAVKKAIRHSLQSNDTLKHPSRKKRPTTLPQIARFEPQPFATNNTTQTKTTNNTNTALRDKHQRRILHLLPARLDLTLAHETTHALAIALYLESHLSRQSTETITVAIDLRAGKGWPNPPARKVVPFVRKITALMERHFPERLGGCILFPLPRAATALWKVVRAFLDKGTAEKICVVSGDAGVRSPPPKGLEEFVEWGDVERMEWTRTFSFQ